MILYWVTTEDHDEDWFVLAPSPEEATQYFENYEGYVQKGTMFNILITYDSSL